MAQTILVVEDSSDISRLLQHILDRAGYEVVIADDGESGWRSFENDQPDLVLLDINLPGVDGLELCRRMKKISQVPIIILTVQAETEAVRRGLLAGADAYLSKPFEITQLIAAVEYALRPRIRRLSDKKEEQGGAESTDH